MEHIKYLGIDHGKHNIGVAFAESETRLAVPYDIVSGDDPASALEMLYQVCINEGIDVVVVGAPLSKDGGNNAQLDSVRNFIIDLKKKIKAEIIEEDERFSTRMAEKLNPKADDSVVAAIILQGYLDKLK